MGWTFVTIKKIGTRIVGQPGIMFVALRARSYIALAAHGTMDSAHGCCGRAQIHSFFSCYSCFRCKSSRVGRDSCDTAVGIHINRILRSLGHGFHTLAIRRVKTGLVSCTKACHDGLGFGKLLHTTRSLSESVAYCLLSEAIIRATIINTILDGNIRAVGILI